MQTQNVVDPVIPEIVSAQGPYAMITVTDTGAGMSAEVLSRVFEPFYTTKPVGEGSGLGLSQVYGFVKQSNGFIDIVSAPGEGTIVRIYLPRARPQLDNTAETSSCAAGVPLGQPG